MRGTTLLQQKQNIIAEIIKMLTTASSSIEQHIRNQIALKIGIDDVLVQINIQIKQYLSLNAEKENNQPLSGIISLLQNLLQLMTTRLHNSPNEINQADFYFEFYEDTVSVITTLIEQLSEFEKLFHEKNSMIIPKPQNTLLIVLSLFSPKEKITEETKLQNTDELNQAIQSFQKIVEQYCMDTLISLQKLENISDPFSVIFACLKLFVNFIYQAIIERGLEMEDVLLRIFTPLFHLPHSQYLSYKTPDKLATLSLTLASITSVPTFTVDENIADIVAAFKELNLIVEQWKIKCKQRPHHAPWTTKDVDTIEAIWNKLKLLLTYSSYNSEETPQNTNTFC